MKCVWIREMIWHSQLFAMLSSRQFGNTFLIVKRIVFLMYNYDKRLESKSLCILLSFSIYWPNNHKIRILSYEYKRNNK